MNTNHRKITPIFTTIFSQLTLMLLLTISVTVVLAGCTSNPFQNQSELKENPNQGKPLDQYKQNKEDDDDDDKKKNSEGKVDDNDDDDDDD